MKPSRAMISSEISWAYVALCLAWAGAGLPPLHQSYLHAVLDRRDWDEAWSIVVGVPALALIFFAAREYIAHRWQTSGRPWTLAQLETSAKVRGICSFALCFSFVYASYVMLVISQHVSAVTPIAMGGAVFTFLSWVENRRVRREIKVSRANAAPAS